jgi:hypothetical protein
MTIVKIIIGIGVIALALVAIGWIGTRVDMQSFAVAGKETVNLGTTPIPGNLPAPVERYARAVFGGDIPLVQSALIVGKVEVVRGGITFPARFKIYHEAGQSYYHFIQMGWFGQTIATVNERYRNGVGIMEVPGSHIENDPKVNAAANQGLWAEAIWTPSVWFTDSRVRWEAVDENTARLIVPNVADEEVFTLRFDPQTGLITEMNTLRYQDFASKSRLPWLNHIFEWQTVNGVKVPSLADVQWATDKPWATWHVENVLYNVDVSARLAQFGGDFQD